MPVCPPKPCFHPGCKSFAVVGKPRCEVHLNAYDSQIRARTPHLALAARIRGSRLWGKVRANFRLANPLCCDPFGHHKLGPEPMYDVHHVLPLATHPHLAHSDENLRPLCRACHNEVEQMERSGKPTPELFR